VEDHEQVGDDVQVEVGLVEEVSAVDVSAIASRIWSKKKCLGGRYPIATTAKQEKQYN